MTDEELKKEWRDQLFAIRRSIRYHIYRRAFFDRFGNFTTFLTIASGGGVLIASGGTPDSFWTTFCGAAAALFGTIDLVLGFALKARDHSDLAKRFSCVEQEMIRIGNVPNAKNLADITCSRLEIENDESPIYRVLDATCHNELVRSYGYSKDQRVKIGWFKKRLQQFFLFSDSDFESEKSDQLPATSPATVPQSSSAD